MLSVLLIVLLVIDGMQNGFPAVTNLIVKNRYVLFSIAYLAFIEIITTFCAFFELELPGPSIIWRLLDIVYLFAVIVAVYFVGMQLAKGDKRS